MSKNRLNPYFLLLLVFLVACSEDDGTEIEPNFTNTLESTNFTLKTPPDWELIPEQGIDTYIGRIQNSEHTIFFDQGFLSFSSLNDIRETPETLSINRLNINGVPALIHVEDRVDGVRLSVYIDAGDEIRKNRLYVFDATDEELILDIIRAHRFKSEINPI